MMIDELIPSNKYEKKIVRWSNDARRFSFDEKAYGHIKYLFPEITIGETYDKLSFAKPPFEKTIVQIDKPSQPMCFLAVPGKIMILIRNGDRPLAIPFYYDVESETFRQPLDSGVPERPLDGKEIAALSSIVSLFFQAIVLLHAPSKVRQTSDKPHRAMIKKGKRVVYRAHHEIAINLLDAEKFVRNVPTGARGGYRAHSVRGTWVHYPKDLGGCVHNYVAVGPDDDKPRFRCSRCNKLRVWRRDHERGDAGLGYVTKVYNVTADPKISAKSVSTGA